jgi:hypothetical protein
MATIYQAGKLVMLRPNGTMLNTHFSGFQRLLGWAVDAD